MGSQRRKINSVLSASCLLSSIFFLYILFLCSCRVDCYPRNTLKQGDWITDNGTTLLSSGGRFELGFFNATGSASPKRFVGIWYKQDQQIVVWVANRDNPVVNATGTFGIADDGNFRVSDTTGKSYWSTHESLSTNRTTLKLMDSGNLVLSDDDDQLATGLWESFKHPTDTFLPGMKMDENLTLTSWIRHGDPGIGIFSFNLSIKGGDRYVILRKAVFNGRKQIPGDFYRINEMPRVIDYLLSNFSRSVSSTKSNSYLKNSTHWLSDYNYDFTRLIMKYTGQLEYLTWDKDRWSLIWRVPEDKCSNISNACGNFGSCNINNGIACKCLPGFKPSNLENWNKEDFLDGCSRNPTSCGKSDTFLSLKMMKVNDPDPPQDLDIVKKNETECRKYCLNNCQCQAYSYEAAQSTTNCRIWTSDLSNLQEEYKNGRNLSVRVAKSDIESTVRNCEPCGTNMIPYPLSTTPNCGDPMYFSFNCNNSTGQVSFKTLGGTYRVTSIDPSKQKFVIQLKYGQYERNLKGILLLNESLPFNRSRWSTTNFGNYSYEVKDEVEISWDPPLEPTCTLLTDTDCKDWPNSTCDAAGDGKWRCLCKQNFRWNGSTLNCTQDDLPPSLEKHSKRKKRLPLSVVVPLISVFALTCSITCVYVWRRKMAKEEEIRSDRRNRALRALDSEKHVKDLIDSGQFKEEDEKGIDVPYFDLESILAATNNFSNANKLGEGGYGPVYKGTFPEGQEIAVKKLSSISRQGLQEFKNEVVLIAKLQHRNLVRLRGYCIKGDEKILLYEYMPNKSLDSFIFDQKLSRSLDWEMRFKIILGIARGLVYLHHDSRLRIIHRDLKTSNILLDEEMIPKISDFGLARIVEGKEIEANTNRVVGTYGYMSPEYALNGFFSIKSDVFSFGVVLLEIISGKKNTGFYQSELAMSLLGYAWRLWVENKVLDLMDQILCEVCNADQFMKCVNIGLLCVQDDPNDRPTMSNVVIMLDSEAATVPTPKRPAFVPGTGPSSTTSSSTRPNTHTESTSSLGGTR